MGAEAYRRECALFVAADLPWPPDGGGRIASLRVLESFARSFDVDLVALADPARPSDPGDLVRLCRTVEIVPHPFTFGLHPLRQGGVAARSVPSRDPYRFRKFSSRALATSVARLVETNRYALVHYEQLGVAQYRLPRLPSTATNQNVEAEIYATARRTGRIVSRGWAALEAAKLGRREAALLAPFGHVFVLSDDDREALRRAGVPRVSTIPIPAPPAREPRMPPAAPTILTLGSMSWFGVADGLRWFRQQAWPAIRAAVPAAEWCLVGSGAPRDIRGWAAEPGISLLGHLPDLEATLARTRVVAVPLRISGGIRIKLLEMMAAGVPTVATERGAQGIAAPDGSGCLRRDDPAGFAAAIVALLRDDDLWQRTTELGRAFIATHHQPDRLDAAIMDGVNEAIRQHRREAARP